jgi:mannose-6-phosphate isomerase-like protein (cupin superfamily)
MTTRDAETVPAAEAYTGDDLEHFLDTLVLTQASRRADWDTLAFQTKAGPQYRRAQLRYVGSGATGDHESDNRIIPAVGFTFSNMLLPPEGEGPEHIHHDAEEAFYVVEGTIEVAIHRDGQVARRALGPRDMVVVPPGVPRSLKNIGDADALFCVIIGTRKPMVPTYPETSPMYGITRD